MAVATLWGTAAQRVHTGPLGEAALASHTSPGHEGFSRRSHTPDSTLRLGWHRCSLWAAEEGGRSAPTGLLWGHF